MRKFRKNKEENNSEIFLENENELAGLKKRKVSDIVSPRGSRKPISPKISYFEPDEDVEEADGFEFKEQPPKKTPKRASENKKRISLPILRRRFAYFTAFLVLFGGGAYLALAVLPRVNIAIILSKKNISFNEGITVDKNLSRSLTQPLSTPGELFKETGNLQLTFPASSKKNIEAKAKGEITIYNAFSSSPQTLVASTRFVTPDNKTFRINKSVTVPGAKIVDGKIMPASVAVTVTADEPGPEYNIGPVKKFTIPGFKGSPKYEGFYGESFAPMAGGFIGEVAVPSDEDLKNARSQISKTLEESLKQRVFSQWPDGLSTVEGSQSFKIIKEEILENISEEGRFGIYLEAEFRVFAFKDSELKDLFITKAKNQLEGSYDVLSSEFKYGIARVDFNKGVMSFPVEASIVLRRSVNLEELASKAAGKNEAELKAVVFSVPELENAKISFWPFWVRTSPKSSDKITIDLE